MSVTDCEDEEREGEVEADLTSVEEEPSGREEEGATVSVESREEA